MSWARTSCTGCEVDAGRGGCRGGCRQGGSELLPACPFAAADTYYSTHTLQVNDDTSMLGNWPAFFVEQLLRLGPPYGVIGELEGRAEQS